MDHTSGAIQDAYPQMLQPHSTSSRTQGRAAGHGGAAAAGGTGGAG